MSQKRILIVDDSEDHRIILSYQLRRLGHFELREASQGQEALEILAREAVDLIFMNLDLPVLDGLEATRRIRVMPSPVCDVPIIAFTAHVLFRSEQQAVAAGCDAYIVKPVLDRVKMKDTVARLLAQGRGGRQP